MTRDSRLWNVLLLLGAVVMALSVVTDPAFYGIPAWLMPYLRLVAFIMAVVGGKLGNSFLPGKNDALPFR